MSLGARMKELRVRRGLTQEQMAEKLGITRANYNKYERDKVVPPSTMLSVIADLLGTTADYLLGREDEVMRFDDLKKGEKDLIILTRQKNLDQMPEEDRRRLYEFFSETIDVFLARLSKK